MQEKMKAVEGLRRKLDWSGPYACPGAHSMICPGPAKDLCSFEHVPQSIATANGSIQKTVCIGGEIDPDRKHILGRVQSFCRSLYGDPSSGGHMPKNRQRKWKHLKACMRWKQDWPRPYNDEDAWGPEQPWVQAREQVEEYENI